MAAMGGERRRGYLFMNSAQLHRPELVYESACAVTVESLRDGRRARYKWLAGYEDMALGGVRCLFSLEPVLIPR